MSPADHTLPASQQKLVENNLRLISFCLRKLGSFQIRDGAYDYEDLWQIGAEGLISAAKNYDPSRGAFSTYACLCIKGEICQFIRSLHAHKRFSNVSAISLDAPISTSDPESGSLMDILPGSEDTEIKVFDSLSCEAIHQMLDEALSPYSRELLSMQMAGLSQQEISKRKGIRPADAAKYLSMINCRLAKALETFDAGSKTNSSCANTSL